MRRQRVVWILLLLGWAPLAAAAPSRAALPLEIRTGVNRRQQLNLYDPDGTRIELMEPRTIDGQPAPASTSPLPVVK